MATHRRTLHDLGVYYGVCENNGSRLHDAYQNIKVEVAYDSVVASDGTLFFLFESLVQQFYRHQKVTYEAVKRNKTS